jgi:hypothetical protein
MTKRFGPEVDIDSILASKYAKTTESFDDYTQRLLNNLLQEKKLTVDYTDVHSVDNMLASFYSTVRKEDGEFFSINTFNGIHHSVARILKKKHNLDILKDKSFTRSNSTFEAMVKELKKCGFGAVRHYPVISDEDLVKIAHWKWETPSDLQLKSWFTLHFHTALRGRENLHDLKKNDIIALHKLHTYVINKPKTIAVMQSHHTQE